MNTRKPGGMADGRRSRRGMVQFSPVDSPSRRLICSAPAGGSSASFASWRRELPRDVDLCAFELPGRGSRYNERPLRSMVAVADHMQALLEGWMDLPFFLFGHSMGAVSALEVAKRLVRAGTGPRCLFVSGSPAPQLPLKRKAPLSRLPRDELIRALTELGGAPPGGGGRNDYYDAFLPTIRADLECREAWVSDISDICIPIIVLGGASDPFVSFDELSAWGQFTSAECTVHRFPGEHFFIDTSRRAVIDFVTTSMERYG